MKFKHKLITFFLLCLYGCSPPPSSANIQISNELKLEVLIRKSDIPSGISRFKVYSGWIYVYVDDYGKSGLTFAPDLR